VSSELRRHHLHNADRFAERRRVPTLIAIAALCGVASMASACSGGIPSPTSELNSGQAVMDLGTLVGELREENSMMQAQIDSLRGALAYQDTIVRQLAAGAGVQMRPPAFSTP
jgi:hypothetical protein